MPEGAEKKGLQLLVEQPTDNVVAYADRRALNQILINLANNAIKFTERGSITIRLSRDAVEDGRVRIDVCDTGLGIAAEEQDRLFRAFSRTSAGTDRRIEGTGLGLYLCRKLIDLMHGEIRFTSVVASGSVFTVLLPSREAHLAAGRSSAAQAGGANSLAETGA